MKLYGIPNCGTVKNARAWLEAHGHAYDFHDYKKAGVPQPLMTALLQQFGWERLINRNGPTWRKLADAVKAGVKDNASALPVMVEHSSVIRRPILERDGRYQIGFSAEDYTRFFAT